MGCANSKTGATGAYGAPEEEAAGGAAPKVMVDGEAQDGAVAANGNAVSCANGAEEFFKEFLKKEKFFKERERLKNECEILNSNAFHFKLLHRKGKIIIEILEI
ncbi:hypothetical protein AVEN_62189-1 [Araneus ventricosus]|uniref:Uncharacterized protein n=1 Tax=Araneus ventricosus TaxID=182803 RepID=A0A4Y2KCF7_ARAVE|nr:hypothetical protein AVEN_62189-1 [Araneus ventricosus]